MRDCLMISTKTAHNFAILQHARDDESYALKRWCQAAETLQRRKVSVDYAPKNGKNFTALSRKGRFRAKKRQKLYTGVKFWSESSAKFRSTRTHRLFPNNSRHSNSCKFLLKLPRIKDIRVIKAHDFIYATFLHKQYLTFRLFVDILMNNTLVSRFE